LGARAREERLPELPGRYVREALGEHDDRRGRVERRRVLEGVVLPVDRGVHLLVAVAERDGEDPAEEVEVLLAGGVVEVAALAARERERLLVVVDGRGEQELLVELADLV